jgi:hypothetical protein
MSAARRVTVKCLQRVTPIGEFSGQPIRKKRGEKISTASSNFHRCAGFRSRFLGLTFAAREVQRWGNSHLLTLIRSDG